LIFCACSLHMCRELSMIMSLLTSLWQSSESYCAEAMEKKVPCSSTVHHSWAVEISYSVHFHVFPHHLFSSFSHVNVGSDNHLIWVLTCILGYLIQPRLGNQGTGKPKVTIELKGRESCSAQKMGITDFCKLLVPVNQTTWCHILEDIIKTVTTVAILDLTGL
jgi:hypothetical protein